MSGFGKGRVRVTGKVSDPKVRFADNPLVTCGTVCFVGSSIPSGFGLLSQ